MSQKSNKRKKKYRSVQQQGSADTFTMSPDFDLSRPTLPALPALRYAAFSS